MNKLERLEELKKNIKLVVEGRENYPKDYSSIIISNHNCLKDIFYLPLAFDEEIVSLISSRLIYKRDIERRKVINKYLNSFPIEAHGGSSYARMCLDNASSIVQAGISVNIFPEGAYINDISTVYKGRTGAARILFKALEEGYYPFFLPVSIDVKSSSTNLDDYNLIGDEVTIRILKPIDYSSVFYDYKHAKDEYKNQILHRLTSMGMKSIAESLNREYIDEYIELYPKGNIIFESGVLVQKDIAQGEEYLNTYSNELKQRTLNLINYYYD